VETEAATAGGRPARTARERDAATPVRACRPGVVDTRPTSLRHWTAECGHGKTVGAGGREVQSSV